MSFGTAIAEGGKQITLQDSFTSKSLLLAHTVLFFSVVYNNKLLPLANKKKTNMNKNPKNSQAKKKTQVDS